MRWDLFFESSKPMIWAEQVTALLSLRKFEYRPSHIHQNNTFSCARLSSNLVARFILDLRTAYQGGSPDLDARTMSSVLFEARSSLSGEMGAPLSTGSLTPAPGPAADEHHHQGEGLHHDFTQSDSSGSTSGKTAAYNRLISLA